MIWSRFRHVSPPPKLCTQQGGLSDKRRPTEIRSPVEEEQQGEGQAEGAAEDETAAAGGWQAVPDPENPSEFYYWNSVSNETTWEIPRNHASNPPVARVSSNCVVFCVSFP